MLHGSPDRNGQEIYGGTEIWYLNGMYHRLDGPAFSDDTGFTAWWVHGRRHRMDGPALITGDGRVEYYINDVEIKSARTFQELTGMSNDDLLAMVLRYGIGGLTEDYDNKHK